MDTINCPVCNQIHKIGEFCPKCGFESRLYAQQPPEAIMRYEQERIDAARKVWKELWSMIEQRDGELNETREQLKSLKSQTDNLHLELEKDADKIKELTRKLNDATSTGEQQSRRIDELKKKLSQAEGDIKRKDEDLQRKDRECRAAKETLASRELPFDFSMSKEKDYLGNMDVKGERVGLGVSKNPNGKVYMGNWKLGMRTGAGLEIGTGGEKYAGEFRMNRSHGVGVLINTDGTRFAGEWKTGKRQGKGLTINPNGETMCASYESDRLGNGNGAYFLQDGSIVCGRMTDAGPTGRCIRYYPDGSVENENWRNGIKI